MRLLNWIFALAVCLLAVNAHAAPKPNVLFIAVDDLNAWIGCLGGHPQALTPNMDRLAKRGVLFTNAHCAAPACNPSRAAVLSGLMPARAGVWSHNSARFEKAAAKGATSLAVQSHTQAGRFFPPGVVAGAKLQIGGRDMYATVEELLTAPGGWDYVVVNDHSQAPARDDAQPAIVDSAPPPPARHP